MDQGERAAWLKLYELCGQLKEMAAWESLWDTDFILVNVEENPRPVLVSVMGQAEECFGIGVYQTEDALKSLFALLSEDNFMVDSLSTPLASQEGLLLYFGNRNEVGREQYKTIRELDLKFRGKNNWIFFESFVIGKVPQQLSIEDVKLLIAVYEKVLIALSLIQNSAIKLEEESFESWLLETDNGENNIRKIDVREVYSFIENPDLKPKEYNDQILLQRLKKCRKIGIDLEITYFYPQISEDGIRYPPILIGGIRESETIFFCDFFDNQEHIHKELIKLLIDFIMEHGKPRAIRIRLWDLEELLTVFCEKVGIMLIVDSDLDVLDMFALMIDMDI